MHVEDRLAGANNWSPWKSRIVFVLEDLKLWDIVEAPVIARFVGKVQGLESGLETGVTRASPPTVTSMGGSFYLGGQVQGRRP
jgi:hypothetical protein